MDQVRDRMRVKHYSIPTERAYMGWIKRHILFHEKKHPRDMGEPEVEAFLTWLAVDGHFAGLASQHRTGQTGHLCGCIPGHHRRPVQAAAHGL